MSGFKRHKLLRIVPSMELDKFAFSSFAAAEYHLSKIKEGVTSPGMQEIWHNAKNVDAATRKKYLANINLFHWHLRAFFWELVAIFDTTLQWTNQRFELGLSEDKVTWVNIPKTAGREHTEWNKKYNLIESVWDSSWYYEIRSYRNFAHRAFLFTEGLYAEQETDKKPCHKLEMIWLVPVREGQLEYQDIIKQLEFYLEQMRRFREEIFKR